MSREGREGVRPPACDVPETAIPSSLRRGSLALPEVAEVDAVRHYVRLSAMNYSVDTGLYPLGSCTMKYNPKVNEAAARRPGLALIHPLQDPSTVQGAMALMCRLQEMIAEIGGVQSATPQPSHPALREMDSLP